MPLLNSVYDIKVAIGKNKWRWFCLSIFLLQNTTGQIWPLDHILMNPLAERNEWLLYIKQRTTRHIGCRRHCEEFPKHSSFSEELMVSDSGSIVGRWTLAANLFSCGGPQSKLQPFLGRPTSKNGLMWWYISDHLGSSEYILRNHFRLRILCEVSGGWLWACTANQLLWLLSSAFFPFLFLVLISKGTP